METLETVVWFESTGFSASAKTLECGLKFSQQGLDVSFGVVAMDCNSQAASVRHDMNLLLVEMLVDLISTRMDECQDASEIRRVGW